MLTIVLIEAAICFVDPNLFVEFTVLLIGSLILIGSIRFLIPVLAGFKSLDVIDDDHFPTVSVIVSAYNEERVLSRTIKSLLEVDYPKDKLEFIYVYEDTCTDRTESILLEFARMDERIKAVKYHGGKATCLNYGISISKGDVICILDADHSLDKYAIKRAVSRLHHDGIYAVRGRPRVINKKDSFIARITAIERDIIERLIIYGTYVLDGFAYFGGSLGFFKRELFEKVGLFDGNKLTEDIDFSARVYEAGYTITIDPTIISWEETPPTFKGWWNQRKRWCRGWVQCAVAHIVPMLKSDIPLKKKIDGTLTWLYNFVPLITISFIPFCIIAQMLNIEFIVPPYLWALLLLIPLIAVILTLIADKKSGERFRWNDIVYGFLMPVYLILYGILSVSAIIDEFILKKPHIFNHTEKTGSVLND
ncbi:MAG TPA: glycosyltransferase family 2 protein [Halobacteria archaeon]|nr:glycosyltransferase family 2 protein [Halobacteria archaeon]